MVTNEDLITSESLAQNSSLKFYIIRKLLIQIITLGL